ncbi:hypothetical protein CCP3SC5AM1_90014 [Gammaproteobacteria bacterium]
MLTFVEIPEYLEVLDLESRKVGMALSEALQTEGNEIHLLPGLDVSIRETTSFVHIISGCCKWFDGKRLVRLYSDGDWLLANPHGAGATSRVVSDFRCHLRVIPRDVFLDTIAKTPALLAQWQHYHDLQTRILLGLVGTLAPEDTMPNFRIKSLRPDEVILTEGATNHEVYLMLEGQASVLVNGHQVGSIEQDEVFGEISFLTEQPRSASVVATSACLVQIIERDQFALLIKSRPELLRRTATTLAQRIVELNTQLISLGRTVNRP